MAATLFLRRETSPATDLTIATDTNPAVPYTILHDWPNPVVITDPDYRDPVPEPITLTMKAATADGLATLAQALHYQAVGALEYRRSPAQLKPVWLYRQGVGETNGVRALVTKITEGMTEGYFGTDNGGNTLQTIPNAIQRMPFWEAQAETAMASVTGATGVGYVYDYSSATNPVGDIPARISYLKITPSNEGDKLGRVWCGLLSSDDRTLANFIPRWECEAGTPGTDAAIVADATASGGNNVTITPGTSTWAKRLSMSTIQYTTNWEDNLGEFLALLRAKVSAGTWEIELHFGYSGMPDGQFSIGPRLTLSNTNWDILPLGNYKIPLWNPKACPRALTSFAGVNNVEVRFMIQVWARRTVGVGTLQLDCLNPMPLPRGFGFFGNFDLPAQTSPLKTAYLEYGEGPAFDQTAIATRFGLTHYIAQTDAPSFRLPVAKDGDGRMVVVWARADQSVLADAMDFEGFWYNCWSSYRGAE
jgi:hypothetical protein